MKKVLITGAAGTIGKNVEEAIMDKLKAESKEDEK